MLDELQRLLDAATPGPWNPGGDPAENIMGDVIGIDVLDSEGLPVAECSMSAVPPGCHCSEGAWRHPAAVQANAELICAMRNAMPALLSRLRAADALRDAVNTMRAAMPQIRSKVVYAAFHHMAVTQDAYDEVRNG